ncbi:MAG: PadR family transcriptional regulator [Pseudolysinimonas sp.]
MKPLSRITEATVAVLEVLSQSDEPCWGLLIIKSSGKAAGSVYPILERLESAGWVTSAWEDDATRTGPRRRYYELTEYGASAAVATIRKMRSPSAAVKVVTA